MPVVIPVLCCPVYYCVDGVIVAQAPGDAPEGATAVYPTEALALAAGCMAPGDRWYCVDGGIEMIPTGGEVPEGAAGPYYSAAEALDSDCLGTETMTCGLSTVELPPRLHLTPTNIVMTDGDPDTLDAGTVTRYLLGGTAYGLDTGEYYSQQCAEDYANGVDPMDFCTGSCPTCDVFLNGHSGTMYFTCTNSDFGGFASLLASAGYAGSDPFCVVVSLFDCCAGIFGRMTELTTAAGWYRISYCTWAKPFTGAVPLTEAGEVVASVQYNYNPLPGGYPWGFTTDIVVSI